jgi:hypothetical protein
MRTTPDKSGGTEMTNRTSEASPRIYARVAGFAYLLIIIIAMLNESFIDAKLIVSGNDAATANNIMANDLLFRIGIAGVLILYTSVVVLSWALYVILKTVDKNLALLAMLFRSGEAILGGATVLLSFVVLLLLNGKGYSTVFETEQLQALAGLFLNVRTAGLDIVLIFVGLGGTIFCYLFFKSRYVPRILAAWGIFTYLSMLVLSFVSILLPNHPVMIETVLYAFGGGFELIFGFWLLIRGVNVQQWDNHIKEAS